jgi:hypothetical protein
MLHPLLFVFANLLILFDPLFVQAFLLSSDILLILT